MPKLRHNGRDSARPGTPARKAEVLEIHRRAGRHFEAAGVRSFVREQGSGPAVLRFHGMIGSIPAAVPSRMSWSAFRPVRMVVSAPISGRPDVAPQVTVSR